jgi:ribonuclease E
MRRDGRTAARPERVREDRAPLEEPRWPDLARQRRFPPARPGPLAPPGRSFPASKDKDARPLGPLPAPGMRAPTDIMAKKMLLDATHAEETRVVVVENNKVDEFDFESLSKRQLTGNIYLAKVTRVEPSLQAAFVEYGGNRHGFLAFSEIHPDYYQIPKEDRDALLAEEAAFARESDEDNGRASRKPAKEKSRSRTRRRAAPAAEGVVADEDAVVAAQVEAGEAPALEGEAAEAEPLHDVPPPSAASGEIDIDVPDEPEDAEAADAGGSAEGAPAESAGRDNGGGYEQVGGDDVEEERQRPRPRPARRYKIQEVIKVRQILLVQVVKEERGNKGAALTTYLSLAGRYCVLMPNTARGGGISRKITQAADRKKLKDIASSLTVPEGAGLIIRTAGANRTKTEIKRDYEYLTRQWEQIRDLTLKSIAPTLIYEEGSLIKRAIRDLYSRDIDEVLVDGERGYREAKDYMKMLMPSHAKNVKHYAEPLPLFSRFQVESYLTAMFNPVVQLKSGGYIVIDVTEALVAIDVNSGRATREANVEDTALKTNLEAAEEAARQMRLRDLAGLIVIDFIDMDERKNNAAVEKRLKEKLKTDRARIQVGRISAFGLLEMSRQRLRPGMIEATTKACPHCHGTGRTRSDDSMALALLRELEEEGVRQRSKEVLIVAPVEIANYLLNQKREHIALIESRFGMSVRVEGEPKLISPDYRVERFKTASRILNVPEPALPVVIIPPEIEEASAEASEEAEPAAAGAEAEGEGGAGRRRRRRRRRGGRGQGENGAAEPQDAAYAEAAEEPAASAAAAADASDRPAEPAMAETPGEPAAEAAEPAAEVSEEGATGGRRSRRRGRNRTEGAPAVAPDAAAAEEAPPAPPATTPFDEVIETAEGEGGEPAIVAVPESETPQPRRRERVRRPVDAVLAVAPAIPPSPEAKAAAPAAQSLDTPPRPATGDEAGSAPTVAGAHGDADAATVAAPEDGDAASQPAGAMAASGGDDSADADSAGEDEPRPRRRGWWSRALGGG